MLELPHAKYFEGILQIRNHTDELLEYIRKKVETDKKAIITKELKVMGGVDLYFSSQRYLRSLGKHLKDRFTGDMKMTRSLHTISRSTGKRLYRVTVLFRLLKYKKGDELEIEGEQWQVMTVDKKVIVKNLRTGQKKQYKLHELERYVR